MLETVIVHDIRKGEQPAHYYVDVSIPDDRRTFLFEVGEHNAHDICEPPQTPYSSFTFRYWMGVHVVSLLCNYHRGEAITFPVDLLDYGIAMYKRRREQDEKDEKEEREREKEP